MENTRNPGLVVISIGIGLAVIFALMGVTGGLNPSNLAYGLAVVSVVVSALIYIFYMRANAVTKTGYAALLLVIVTGLIIPFLAFSQPQAQANAQAQQYDLTLKRGAALFGQYCSTCHGFLGQGLNGPQLNDNSAVNKLSDQDLTRIISGGIANPSDPSKLLMPAWLNTYGGSLTQDDITYLVALIRSSDPQYRSLNHLENVNGFDYVFQSLTNPTQIAEYEAQKKAGNGPQKPPATSFVDLSSQKTITIEAVDDANNPSGFGWQIVGHPGVSNVIIAPGTVVTWVNHSSGSTPHDVVSQPSAAGTGKFPDSAIMAPGAPGYSYTFTKAGDYPFICGIHPAMTGWITVK